MIVWVGLGPLGVILLALAWRWLPSKQLPVAVAVWVTLMVLAVGVRFSLDHWHGGWSLWVLMVVNVVAATSAWDSVWWAREHKSANMIRYFIWWALFYTSLLVIALANNLVLAWLAIEFSTLVSGALIVEMGHRRALEAAWKYIVVASAGMLTAIIGIVFLYASLQTERLGWHTLDYANLQAHYLSIAPIVREIATVLIVCGIGTKAGLVPFHTWLPDAHSVAPSPVSGLLSGVLLGLCLIAVNHFVTAVPLPGGMLLAGTHLLLLFGSLSVVVGALALLVQRDVKRMLAYSSIEQVGIMAIGFGVGTRYAIAAALLQFMFHALIKSSLFYIGGHLSVRYHSMYLRQMKEMARRQRGFAIAWTIGILALAGLPPLGLAYSEWMILYALWQSRLWPILIVLSLGLVLGFAGLLQHLINGVWGKSNRKSVDVNMVGGGVTHG